MEVIFKKEIWKDIKNYEGLYQVSNIGRVRSLYTTQFGVLHKRIRILTPTDNGNGYLIISLSKNKKRKKKYIHRLVAEAFINNDKNYKIINHIDKNKQNNNVNNLEWCTQKYNVLYSIENFKKPKKTTHTNTGEKYITYRKSSGRYRIIINRKEYKTTKTLEEAIKVRDKVLGGGCGG